MSKRGISEVDRTGLRQGRITVLDKCRFNARRKKLEWKSKCDCGKVFWLSIDRFGHKPNGIPYQQTCGCGVRTINRAKHRIHGFSDTRFYKIYIGAQARCNGKKNGSYHRYGARGIKFLFTSFNEFKDCLYSSYLEHVKKFGEQNTTLERINNDGHYEPSNCKWATISEQARNRRERIYRSFEIALQQTIGQLPKQS